MRRAFVLLACLLPILGGCDRQDFPPATATACQSPFVGLATSRASAEDQAILREASEDFCAVVAGNKPVHARFDTEAALPSDGGTLFYVGRKYRLTVLNSLSDFGSFQGTAHGPIITFDEAFAPGNTREISSIRVYESPAAPDDAR